MDRLIVCGGGHCGVEVVRICLRLDFDVIVVDDRPEFAEAKRFPGATVLCAPFEKALDDLGSRDTDYYVVVTRGHAMDAECVAHILRGSYAYVGMIGSRHKVAGVRRRLLGEGFTVTQWETVHAPIGIEIGSETPAEVAVSIAAQLIAVRSAKGRGIPEPPERQGILCTIIEKHGSAPRRTGTWMLVSPGEVIGTVGGGSLENAVMREAKGMWESGMMGPMQKKYVLEDSADLGMTCGGTAVVEFIRQ